ncbi:MAG: methylisocitrate lyase [Nitrospira sp.]|nr:methylisocitrate lyase [Nitrospira sp.]
MTSQRSTITTGQRLRELLERGTIAIPGAFNALTALQIERAGFEAIYVSGAAVCAARGLPDIGLITLEEMAADAGVIAKAVAIPVIVDADTGYGPPSVVREAVRQFERAGLAGMQLEDQEAAKKCGHLPGKRLVPVEDMVAKLSAAVEARSHRDFLIVARTDARAVEGLEGAIRRATAYIDAGADILFPEALLSTEEFRTFAEAMTEAGVHVPLMANMTEFGRTPYLAVKEFAALGYRAVLFPVSALRVAAHAIESFLAELYGLGTQRDWLDHMMPRQNLYDLLRYDDHHASTGRPHEPGHAGTTGSKGL